MSDTQFFAVTDDELKEIESALAAEDEAKEYVDLGPGPHVEHTTLRARPKALVIEKDKQKLVLSDKRIHALAESKDEKVALLALEKVTSAQSLDSIDFVSLVQEKSEVIP